MARGALSESERSCLEPPGRAAAAAAGAAGGVRPGGLRVRFVDEEGRTERLRSSDEPDAALSPVKKIHFMKNRSSSETSFLLRNPSLGRRPRRRSEGPETLNNNSRALADYNRPRPPPDESDPDLTKDTGHYKKNANVYSVHQARTLTAERAEAAGAAAAGAAGAGRAREEARSSLPVEEEARARGAALARLSRGLGRLLRRSTSVRISDPDPEYKVAYLGNVLTGWARGESCVEKPLATLWRNYQQSSKPDVAMKLSVTNSGLKGLTKEHGLTEYWAHRVTYCASPPQLPRLFCWVYRHEGKKLRHELRCHAVLCAKDGAARRLADELQQRLRRALLEFKKDRISKQNARLSLANSVYDNPSMPRRKILLSVGSAHYRPPLERSRSAPKLGAIEELCSEEEAEAAPAPARPPRRPREEPGPRDEPCPREEPGDDGSVSSGCETASTAMSDSEPSSLPPLDDAERRAAAERRDSDSACSDESGYAELGADSLVASTVVV